MKRLVFLVLFVVVVPVAIAQDIFEVPPCAHGYHVEDFCYRDGCASIAGGVTCCEWRRKCVRNSELDTCQINCQSIEDPVERDSCYDLCFVR